MLNLLPTPKKCDINEDNISKVKSSIFSFDKEWENHIEIIKEYIMLATDEELTIEKGGIELYRDDSLKSGEYRLEHTDALKAYASDYEGMCYASASIVHLLASKKTGFNLPELKIFDYADKEYRGFMIDLARQWHPFRQLLSYVDLCFLYKIKYLQLHFMDNQLETLPSKAFPDLATKGKHYTFDQIEKLNEYAKKRGIILVPEYECPGHATQFTKIYPEVFGNKYDEGVEGIHTLPGGIKVSVTSLICAGSEKCTDATKAILKEIADMFPDSPYIHIGGDEAAIGLWNSCETCRNYMKEKGIKDEHELYCEYVGRIAEYVLSLGKTPIVWEGFSKEYSHYIPKKTIVIAWESLYNYSYDLLADGFKVINASWKPMYIVPVSFNALDIARDKALFGTKEILDWNIYSWSNWLPASKSTLNPIRISPTDDIIGAMMCSWEQTYEQEINKVMENLLTMSERVWNIERVCTYDEYIAKQGTLIAHVSRIIQDR